MFSYDSVFELLICYMADDRVLKFLYDADLRHVESPVRCHRKYKNGRIKVDLG